MRVPVEAPARSRPAGADLCEIADLDDDALFDALSRAQALAVDGAAPHLPEVLRGRTVLVHFGEPSTRTRMSFEIAARRLGADFVAFAGDHSTSAAKGETLLDAVRNVDAMGPDVIVVRERHEGWPRALTECLRARVVNAGDGCNEHPTQGLLDALTILEAFGRSPQDGDRSLRGVRVAICGDIAHSRVAGSDLRLLPRLGAEVIVAGPAGLVDPSALPPGVAYAPSLEAAITGVDVVMMLRIQRERLPTALDLPSDAAYHALWGLSSARLELAAPHAIVMHPGPMNRGVEIADAVADGPRSRILRQVALGVAARMVVLARACDRHALLPIRSNPQDPRELR
ncbi:MAG: aspartate carbamoyltransferase catalytic subunit [Nannocystaceae bacterium]